MVHSHPSYLMSSSPRKSIKIDPRCRRSPRHLSPRDFLTGAARILALLALLLIQPFGMMQRHSPVAFAVTPAETSRPANAEPPPLLPRQGLITVTFKDGDIRDILAAIGMISGVNIVTDATVQGRMTITLKNVTLDEAIRSICNVGGFNSTRIGSVYHLSKLALPKPLVVEATDGLLTIDATLHDIREVLQRMAQVAGKNIVPTQNVTGQVTFSVKKVPFDAVLNTMAAANGLTVEKRPPDAAAGAEGVIYLIDRAGVKPPTAPEQPSPSPMDRGGSSTPGPPVTPQPEIRNPKSDKVTFPSGEHDLAELLQNITEQTGVAITTVSDISGKRSLRLKEATVEQSLEALLLGTKYWYVKHGEGYWIGDVSSPTSREAALFITTERVPLKYIKPEDASLFLAGLTSRESAASKESIRPLKSDNALLIAGTTDVVKRMKDQLALIDLPAPQVMLQAILLEVNKTFTKDLGLEIAGEFDAIKGQGPTGAFLTFASPAVFDRKLTATLSALVTEGKARVLANPRIATLNGMKANIDIVQERYFRTLGLPGATSGQSGGGTGTGANANQNLVVSPFVSSQIEKIQAGIRLEITPWVGADGDITVEVTPEVSNITGVTPEGLPELSTRRATTTIRVKDGQNIVIGGLRQREVTRSLTKPWLLGDIPWLGKLFQHTTTNKRDTELVILVTPTVLKPDANGASESLRDLNLPSLLNPQPQTSQKKSPASPPPVPGKASGSQ